jgi:NAD(P)-dependent dehydrogenase (short-subunit alcohol dehydrogenase family)
MSGQVENKVALVTGGGSGIGRATAIRYAAEGASVVVADVDLAAADETARLIGAAGGDALAAFTDVTDAKSVDALVELAVSRYGRLDCAHNNAGVLGPVTEMLDYPIEEFHRVMDVNLTGVWLCMRAEIALMLEQEAPPGGHSIVNTASVAGLTGSPMLPAYCASKHAVVGLTKAAAKGYGERGIRVNCVCPGPIDTPLAGPLFEHQESMQRILARQAMQRFASVEEVASVVVWLSSSQASYVTGVPMRVDAAALA